MRRPPRRSHLPTLLLEIGCEELPASACEAAAAQLPDLVRAHVWADGEPRIFVGPRRLAFLLQDLPEHEADRTDRRRGPSEEVAFDAGGKPTAAAEGFARSNGVAVDELERADGFVWATRRTEGRRMTEVLPDALARVVRGLAFPKTMRWDGGGLRFARPVRWLCAKLDGETVTVSLDPIPSEGTSQGHRFVAGEVEIPAASEYAERLRDAGVEPDQDVRREEIVRALEDLGEWSDPYGVLDEVIHLVERPLVLTGRYDERFLELPARVVETVMQSHQRYFPLEPGRFAFVANGGDPDVIRAGHENVLAGRLDDAAFSYARDVELGIEAMRDRLPAITFHARAGSFAEKAVRLASLSEALGGGEASVEAAALAKADQASTMVHEFPELEGVIGAVYAREAGMPEAVAKAIEEQYLPAGPRDRLPETAAGRVLAAVDRVDNLAVAFALGERPTGSRDPYGLRRGAIGLCRLAVEGGLEIPVPELVARDLALLTEQGADVSDDPSEVWPFVLERLEGLLDVPVEFVRAARAAPVAELRAVALLARALAAAADSASFTQAHTAYDRASRLAGRANGAASELDPRLITDEAEAALVGALAVVAPRMEAAVEERDFAQAIEAAGELGAPVGRFFDEVLVMAEDRAVRANRLRLLLDVRDALAMLGDLSQIPR
ncbi:MAG TPA: glycine--tRNA ligase subunit beta [Gaiellaceae bacterium]|nr:glycine--tRNA ligase subunit beta [Gaiellaceae bacterium]